jgi:hypothetical protein
MGKFEEQNTRCSKRKFMFPNIKALKRKFKKPNIKFGLSLFGASLLNSHLRI